MKNRICFDGDCKMVSVDEVNIQIHDAIDAVQRINIVRIQILNNTLFQTNYIAIVIEFKIYFFSKE